MFGAPQFQSIAAANAQLAKGKSPGTVFVVRFDLEPGEGVEAGIRLRRSSPDPGEPAQEETIVGVNTEKGLLFLDRSHSGKTDWSPDFPPRMIARLKHPQLGSIHLEIVVDKNSIEVFADDGETVLTSLIYPSESSQGISFYATQMPPGFEPARIRRIELFPIKPLSSGK
jgi:levanase